MARAGRSARSAATPRQPNRVGPRWPQARLNWAITPVWQTPAVEFDLTQTDALLSTTRAVRKRLDFGREVSDDVLLECLQLAG